MTWKQYIEIPKGYRKLEYGERMKSDDLIHAYNKNWVLEWRLMGDCDETSTGFPYNESYRAMVRKEDA